MRSVGWNVHYVPAGLLVSLFVYFAAAQIPKKCGPPSKYPHARLQNKYTAIRTFNHGEKVYYKCADDLIPSSGFGAVQCLRGEWTKLTLKCQKRSCGYAGDLLNGHLEYEGKAFIGERLYAVCNKGYTLNGPSSMICKKSGWSGKFPSCEVSPAGEATCVAPVVENSVSSGGGVSEHRVGGDVYFNCKRGFQLRGARKITCGPAGQWQTRPPQCVPSHDATPPPDKGSGCGVPEASRGANANLADKYITVTSFASGDRVYYSCDVGYAGVRGRRYRKCTDGKWTPLLLRCERKLCGSAGEIVNGQFTYTGVQFGDMATAVCDEGHRLVGKATRNCLSQGWDGRVPVCEAVACDDPPVVTDAEMESRLESLYTYRSVVSYRCKVGTLNGPSEIWCTKDGTWSEPPTCAELTCLPPNVPGAFWTRAWKRVYQHMDTIYIECDPRYRRIGPSIISCGGDGRWTPGVPRCSPRVA